MDGRLVGCLGWTEPLDCDYVRGLVSVRMRDRKRTLYENVPSHFLSPVHPTGPGDMVVMITEPHRGDVYCVHAMDSDGTCSLTRPGGSDVVLESSARSLAILLSK